VEDRTGPQFRDVYDKSYDARYTYFTCRLLVTSCTHVRTASVRSYKCWNVWPGASLAWANRI